MSVAPPGGPVADAAPLERRGLPIAFLPLALTYLAVALNMTVTSVALPTISTDLNATTPELLWIVNITPLAGAALILFAGSWGDRYGRRRLLLIGIAVFLVSALLSSIATSPTQLIVLRAITGIGSALTMPAALALTFDVVHEASRRTAVGIISATQAVGSLLGPLLAGALLVAFSWGSAFLTVVPFLLVSLVLVWARVPKDVVTRENRAPLDTVGALLMAVAGTALLFAAVTASSRAQSSAALVTGAVVVGVIATAALILWERRCANPIFVGSIMRNRAFWVPTLTILMVQFVLGGVMFVNTQYVQLALGFSAFAAGAFLLPALVMWIASAATAGLTARRFGVRAVVGAGLAAASVGLVLVGMNGLTPAYPMLVLGLLLLGCMGVAPALMTHMAVSSYPEARRTVGSAINSVAVRFGLAFGVAAFGSTLTATYAAVLAPSLTGLAPEQVDLADNSLGGALRVGSDIGGAAGAALTQAGREAFASGFQTTLFAAAAVLAVLTVVTVVAMPRRSPAIAIGPAVAAGEE